MFLTIYDLVHGLWVNIRPGHTVLTGRKHLTNIHTAHYFT